MGIKIINAFVEMRKSIQRNANIFARLGPVERCQIAFESETEKTLKRCSRALEVDAMNSEARNVKDEFSNLKKSSVIRWQLHCLECTFVAADIEMGGWVMGECLKDRECVESAGYF